MLNPLVTAAALLTLVAGPAVALAMPAPDWDAAASAMQHITIHVPRITIMSTTTIITSEPVRRPLFREKKADDCVKTKKVVGFSVPAVDSVDFMLEGGKVLRAKLGAECPVLGFYSGLYVKPNPDGKMCVGRDMLRSRSGTSCGIQAFRALVPVR